MRLSNNALDYVTGLITGDSEVSPYRTGSELCDFFASFGARDLHGQDFPSRRKYTRSKLDEFNGSEVVKSIVIQALDFWHSNFDPESAGFEFNKFLMNGGLRLTYSEGEPVKIDDTFFPGPKSFIFVGVDKNPVKSNLDEVLVKLDQEHVQETWRRALNRTKTEPDSAITAARTLLESTCKIILDELDVVYDDNATLPKLWSTVSEQLNLSPSQHHEEAFKTILGNCQRIVGTLGELRNKISDAHGQGRRPVKAKPRHAELAVNLAGSMALFLVSTWLERENR